MVKYCRQPAEPAKCKLVSGEHLIVPIFLSQFF